LYLQRHGESVDAPEPQDEVQDGIPGVTLRGSGAEVQRAAYSARLGSLFAGLQEVKDLYVQRHGESVDAPEPQELFEVQDGVPGVMLRGSGAAAQRAAYSDRLGSLFAGLQEVKDSYAQKYGESVDAPEPQERSEVQDGVPGVTVMGIGAEEQRLAYTIRTNALFEGLQEAKKLYAQKFGESVDEEDISGICVYGCGATAQKLAYEKRLSALFDGLQEVKIMYAKRCGEGVDVPEPEEFMEAQDGVPGVTVAGRGVEEQRVAYAGRLAALFDSLREAKNLYAQKYGKSADASEPEERTEVVDGVPGVTMDGRGAVEQRAAYLIRVNSLFASLQEVKGLYERRCGEDVDASEAELRFEAEGGVPGVTLTGRGAEEQRASYATRVGALLARLRDVKALYAQRVGEQVDEDDSDASDAGDWPPALAEGADELPRRSLAVPPLQSRLGLWARWAVRWEEGQELCGQGRPPAEHSGSDAESDCESE